ncbi:MFS transporter [Jiangella sp. DSM 45060]|uniref:MFS transporter n=1 Tax=Jiangella sp. DSM 45060 TaxID=1798224 RepID=UPI000879572D|nr:MFS transporter [Jiangella sp. DSM 45060]SDT50619.1 Major Facilitator Superfamily protein [Jiangella sp. DSM 45060]
MVFLAQFMVILNGAIVVVALPAIQRDLDFGTSELSWVVTAYLLGFGGFLLLGGRTVDLIGHRRALQAGTLIFIVAAVAGSVAESSLQLLAARTMQGLGAAVIAPATFSSIVATFPDGPRRQRAIGLWAGVTSVAGSSAFLLGGVLTDALSWEAAFYVNVLLGLAIFVGVRRAFPEAPRPARVQLDVRGAVTVTAACAAVVYALAAGRDRGWTSVPALAAAAGATLLAVSFVLNERSHPAPLIRLKLARARRFVVAVLIVSVVAGTMTAVSYFMTLFFQQELGYSPTRTGLAFLAPTAALSIAAVSTRWLIQRLGAYVILPAGLLALAVGALTLTRVAHGGYLTSALPALTVMYAGVGCAGVTVAILATADVSAANSGTASGVIATARELGGAIWFTTISGLAGDWASATDTAAGSGMLADNQRLALACAAGLAAFAAVGALAALRRT